MACPARVWRRAEKLKTYSNIEDVFLAAFEKKEHGF